MSSPECGQSCDRTCKGQLRVSVHPPSCHGGETVPAVHTWRCHHWKGPRQVREEPPGTPTLEVSLYPFCHLSEVLHVIIHIVAVHLAGRGRGQA